MPLQIKAITDVLPADLALLRADAADEGYRQLDRLAAEWAAGSLRFDRDGEALLTAHLDGEPAGIGGISLDPAVPDALRMRRFYVRPAFRRRGVGRALALALLDRPACRDRTILVNAGTTMAPRFWESLGFVADPCDGHTHRLQAPG